MNKKELLSLFVIMLSLSCFQIKSVDWSGDITADVVDQNITITGNCTIVGPGVMPTGQISVSAVNQNIQISATDAFFIQGRTGGESDLYFYAAENRTITFDVNYDFDFKGSPDGTDMLVTFSGPGTLIFNLADGVSLSFTSEGNSGGVKFMVRMEPPSEFFPTVLFERDDTESNNDVNIVIGPKSLISYIAPTKVSDEGGGERGQILFSPNNTVNNTGRMILNIETTGGLYIGGNWVDAPSAPRLSNMHMDTPAGAFAQLGIQNELGDNYHAGLLVLNYNTELTDMLLWRYKTFMGRRYGFILGANAFLEVGSRSYLDYVGLANNSCPELHIPEEILMGRLLESVIKERNPSAFMVDGNRDPNATAAQIIFKDPSAAIYFRSGVDTHGDISGDFIVDKADQTAGAGEIVFGVEGQLRVRGPFQVEPGPSLFGPAALQILSLQVDPFGGSILYDSNEINFPKRTFNKNNGQYLTYNKAAFFINNNLELFDTYLVHTDENHTVCENNNVISEPTYIGGESFTLNPQEGWQWPKPKMSFYGSYLYVHTNIAFTGLDLFVPNREVGDGITIFKFFGNGYKIDNGSGRNMILGTFIGSLACDGCTPINPNSYLDIFQYTSQIVANDHELRLTVSCNNNKIVENIESEFLCGSCQDEPSIHTIYLGNASNISIGSQGQTWDPATNPTLNIAGNYFSFATQGGIQCCPQLSSVTGEGGIFVDQYGTITIDPCYRANISTMVVQSGNGEIDLPPSNVFFNNKVGITKAPLDLATNTIIVDKGETISDYTLVWPELKKDYGNFCPYVVPCVPECYCPVITTSNLEHIPTVKGEVGQLQIEGATFANPPHIKVDSGHIREFVFFEGCKSGEAPAAVIILKNDAEVGLGSTHVNKNSLNASVVLGINGITIIAEAGEGDVDNDGRINLNQDIEINNMCHILTGPKFGADERDFTLRIYSDTPKKIVVKKGGVLNLCSFTQPNQIVEIGGKAALILEPGAKVMLNGGTLRITDNAGISCTQVEALDQLINPTSVASTDDIRVKFVGTGMVEFREGGGMGIGKWAYVGIETDDCINTTSLVFALTEQSQLIVGGDEGEGGVLQIGNTSDKENASISFTLLINGEGATFGIGPHACFGLGVGVADNTPATQNDWLVGNLYNLKNITIAMPNGAFAHNQTYAGSDDKASLFAIDDSQDTTFNFSFDTIKSTILGGGNIALINSQDAPYNLINPVVETTDFNYPYADLPEPPFVLPGIMSSKSFLKDMFGVHKIQLDNTGLGLYGYLKVLYNQNSDSIFATTGPNDNNKTIVGYVTQGTIMRPEINSILSRRGTDIDHEFSQRVGIIGVRLNDDIPAGVMQTFELPADFWKFLGIYSLVRIPGVAAAALLSTVSPPLGLLAYLAAEGLSIYLGIKAEQT